MPIKQVSRVKANNDISSGHRGNSLFKYRPCPLCGCEQIKYTYPINKDFPSRLSGFDLTQINIGVSSCSRCKHQFIHPVPTSRFLASYYDSYLNEAKENFYRNRRHNSLPQKFRQTYSERLCRIQQVLGRTGSLLDVGCGFGMFLRLAKEYGFRVNGVEASEDAVRWLSENYKIDVINCLFENFETDEKFDVITMWDLLEHLSDPIAALRKAFNLVRPGGILVVEAPARDSLVHWVAKVVYRASLGQVTTPLHLIYGVHHLQYFSTRALGAAVRHAGFDVVEVHQGTTDLQSQSPTQQYSLLGSLKYCFIKIFFTLGQILGKSNKRIVTAIRHPEKDYVNEGQTL